MYAIEPIQWIKAFIVIGIFLLLLFIFNSIMRKYLNVEKHKKFSSNHVNEKHKKIDWAIRIIFVISLIILTYIGRKFYNYEGKSGYLITIALTISVVISEIVRAFMEWKYAENKKLYLLTISQTVFFLMLLFIMSSTNFFNVF